MSPAGTTLSNEASVPLRNVPVVGMADFRRVVLEAVANEARVAALFGEAGPGVTTRLYAVMAHDREHHLSVVATDVGRDYASLTPECPEAHLFEREILEQFGVVAVGHPWLKPARAHTFPTTGPSPATGLVARTPRETHPFFSMGGRGMHEVAVGPVHAGVIEPGHFRFQCNGEIVHHLEIQLGYQHRGIENALAGGPHPRTRLQMETIAGDTTLGHCTAYCQALEALGGFRAPPRAQAIRAVALEMERLANHTGDIGALSDDVGFLPTSAFCGRLRGEFLNMTTEICGSRLGRGLVVTGGTVLDISDDMAGGLLKALGKVEPDLKQAVALFFGSPSVLSRLTGTGPVTAEAARDLGVVGPTARATGLKRDARADHPFGWYRGHPIPVSTHRDGDVLSRSIVRWLEIQASLRFVKETLAALPAGPHRIDCPPAKGSELAVSVVEGWRGEVVHVAITNSDGHFRRYKIVDPSAHNWNALALSMRGQQISDFPLCNKSFNLSYCGVDQ